MSRISKKNVKIYIKKLYITFEFEKKKEMTKTTTKIND